MVGFGNIENFDGVKKTYKEIVDEFFGPGTTFITPNSETTHYDDYEQPEWGKLTETERHRMEKERKIFEQRAVTRLDVRAEVEKMLEEATFVTPNGLNAGIVSDKRQAKVKE